MENEIKKNVLDQFKTAGIVVDPDYIIAELTPAGFVVKANLPGYQPIERYGKIIDGEIVYHQEFFVFTPAGWVDVDNWQDAVLTTQPD